MSASSIDTDRATIGLLKRSDVEKAMADLKPFLRQSRWIGDSNYYIEDTVKKLNTPPANAQEESDLAQYIAASTCLHVNDGWSYLGRAISCLLAGDSHRALHLGYYAELRAAMSLLAGTGIGVFNRKHYAIISERKIAKLNCESGTHIFSWLALQAWAEQPTSGTLFSTLVRPEGQTLSTWFQPRGGAPTLAAQARNWFLQWGMDLALVTQDREARNNSSYQPDGIPTIWRIPVERIVGLVRCIWEMLEPRAGAPFAVIDLHILRLALENYYTGISGETPSPEKPNYISLVKEIVDFTENSASANARLVRFLSRQEATDDPVIFKYAKASPNSSPEDIFGIISRAVLLLRVATGSTHSILNGVGIGSNLLSFWWRELGSIRELWGEGNEPSLLGDLWADIQVCLDDLGVIEAATPEVLKSTNEIAIGLEGRLPLLASHERVGLWGLCPT